MKISNINNNILNVLTFDIFVVTAGLGFLTEGLALLLAGDEGFDGDAVLPAHDALGWGHVDCPSAGLVEETLWRFAILSLVELVEITLRVF